MISIFGNLFGGNDLISSITQGDWEHVVTECESHPHKAREWTIQRGFFDGEHDSHVLPLHQAVVAPDPSLKAIHALIHAYPHATFCRESAFKRLPLHLACQNQGSSSDLVRILLSYAPDAAMERDSLGRLALHYASSNKASVRTIDSLLKVNPCSACCRDLHGWLPLHVACRHGASFLVIQRLLDAYPDCVDARTDKGSTPVELLEKIDCPNKKEIVTMLKEEAMSAQHNVEARLPPLPPVYPKSFYKHATQLSCGHRPAMRA